MVLAIFVATQVMSACSVIGENRAEAATRQLEFRGGELYSRNCLGCHGDRDALINASGAPPHNEHGHTWHHPDPQLTDWILHGKPGGRMPPYGDRLTNDDVPAILAFVKTWWTPEQRRTQADVSRNYDEFMRDEQPE
ncbi:MAG: cytochrome c [Chloroflexi bacterium]|nr:cytochrome c [Chloroflexota bacterium]